MSSPWSFAHLHMRWVWMSILQATPFVSPWTQPFREYWRQKQSKWPVKSVKTRCCELSRSSCSCGRGTLCSPPAMSISSDKMYTEPAQEAAWTAGSPSATTRTCRFRKAAFSSQNSLIITVCRQDMIVRRRRRRRRKKTSHRVTVSCFTISMICFSLPGNEKSLNLALLSSTHDIFVPPGVFMILSGQSRPETR